ncbi:ROK family protein [Candidatus Galacturonibacter soehngenii]|uniref:ROK family protein n=1 Tax=Candidatus Galacturonatibacter soehngenii TaxID=2307010 RepID=A0A7V7QK84_9FIRM|nr:ROK family protein [Candidatus Galacturonibacter soehngenii]KAB1437791.1 ROK family protein [Candidatus Galacturonibacter soehngenii]
MDKRYLAIDVGGTEMKYALMTEQSDILERGKIKTTFDNGVDGYIDNLVKIYTIYEGKVDGIALSMPGVIDSDEGIAITGGSFLFINHTPVAKLLSKRCNVRVSVENDGKCAALAESWNGSLKDCKDGIVIVLGTGVGGGIIKDKKIYKGKHFAAGEFSFILLGHDYESIENVWGMKSGNKRLRQMVACAKNQDFEELDGIKIFEMANANDTMVLKALDRFVMEIAKEIFNLQNILDPELIAIGGGISKQDLLISMIQEKVDYIYQVFPIQTPSKAKIVRCHYNSDANLIGALKHHLDSKNERDK